MSHDERRWNGHPGSGMIPMPEGFSIYNGSSEKCDMAAGPCSCGGGHSRKDWMYRIHGPCGYSDADKDVFRSLIAMVDEMDARGYGDDPPALIMEPVELHDAAALTELRDAFGKMRTDFEATKVIPDKDAKIAVWVVFNPPITDVSTATRSPYSIVHPEGFLTSAQAEARRKELGAGWLVAQIEV